MIRRPLLASLALAGSLLAHSLAGAELSGSAVAIDGDTIVIAGQHVRLAEIDAPELRQTCWLQPDPWATKIEWFCGKAAAAAMHSMLARDPAVSCAVVTVADHYGRVIAHCSNGEGDLAARLVALGLAVVWPRYSTGRYEAAQEAARAAKAGMWFGEFVMPWNYRHNGTAPFPK